VTTAISWWNSLRVELRTRALCFLGLLAIGFSAACGGVPRIYTYTLQVPAAPPPSAPRTDYVLGVEHFRSPEMLRDDRIIYYVSPTEINFYDHHHWGAEPAALLSEFAAQWLEASGVFARVRMLPGREPVDYTLGGTLFHFEEVDTGERSEVRLALALSLVRARDHKLVWSGQQRVEAPVSERSVAGVASALNASCAQAMRALVPGLIAQVEQDFKGSAQ